MPRMFKQWRNRRRLAKRDAEFAARAARFASRFPELSLGPSSADRVLSFSHAGNAGDVIFSLPTLCAIGGGRPADFVLRIDAPAFYAEGKHPLGDRRLDAATAKMLKPLLEAQPYIRSCAYEAYDAATAAPVDYALDLFREAPIPGDKGYLARWPMYIWGVDYDLSEAWLQAPPDTALADTIVIARSQRYRNPVLDYRFLARYPRLAFIGVDVEFAEMRAVLPRMERIAIPDFLGMASAIAGCRLFVGNQSLPYSIAEALKVPRVLEACHRAPTNVPHGRKAYDAYFQPQFEFAVKHLVERG